MPTWEFRWECFDKLPDDGLERRVELALEAIEVRVAMALDVFSKARTAKERREPREIDPAGQGGVDDGKEGGCGSTKSVSGAPPLLVTGRRTAGREAEGAEVIERWELEVVVVVVEEEEEEEEVGIVFELDECSR